MKISNIALVAALAVSGITASNASLTEDGLDAILGTDTGEANAIGALFPDGDLEDQAAEAKAIQGDQAAYDAAHGVLAALDDAPGNGAGSFVNATHGPAIPLFAALPDQSLAAQDAALRAMFFRLLNVGVNGGGNQAGVIAAGGVTEDTVTWSRILEAVATIGDHG